MTTKKTLIRLYAIIAWTLLIVWTAACGDTDEAPTEQNQPDPIVSTQKITILETSDLHTNLMPWDYFSGAADPKRGLNKIATLIKQERNAGCTLLVDDGDTIQGTPLGSYYALVDKTTEHPMATVMNHLQYDVMEIGNHEFNYGLSVLDKFVKEVKFPVLGANIRRTDGSEAYTPFIIKEVCGVKVGILGLVTPGISTWERPENIAGLKFDDPIETAKIYVPKVREQGADLVIVALHGGPGRQPATASDPAAWLTDYNTWPTNPETIVNENPAIKLAEEVAGIDGILSGHSHLAIPKMMVKDTIIVEPKHSGAYLGKLVFEVKKTETGQQIISRDSQILAVDEKVAEDPDAANLAKSAHETTLAYVDAPIGHATAQFAGGFAARLTDSPLADLINRVQEDAAQKAGFPVDISLSAIFTDPGLIPQGQIKLRDAYSVYLYDNTLYILEINGSILRRALEKNAEYFNLLDLNAMPATIADCKVKPTGPDYNWDIYSGIDYTIDLTKPVGSRVTMLRFKNAEVTDDMTFRVALNNYRAGGGGGFSMFKEGKILWTSFDGVREMLVDFIKSAGTIDPRAISKCNFTLQPDLYAYYLAATAGPSYCPVQ